MSEFRRNYWLYLRLYNICPVLLWRDRNLHFVCFYITFLTAGWYKFL